MKFIKQITDKDEKAPWIHLARYWLGFQLAPLNPEWQFLRSNSLPKPETNSYMAKPKYYVQMLENIKLIDINQAEWTTPYFYQELTKIAYKTPNACTKKWNQHDYNPDEIWKPVYISYAQGIHQDIHYKFLHRALPSKVFKSQRQNNYQQMTITCKTCPKSIETNEHIFHECKEADKILKFIYPTINEILKPKNFHTIWLNRNSILFDRRQDQRTFKRNKIIIYSTFSKIIKKKLKEYMPNSLDKFKANFCHTPQVCTLIHDKYLKIRMIHDDISRQSASSS